MVRALAARADLEEKLRFLIVGAGNTAFGYALFLLILTGLRRVITDAAGGSGVEAGFLLDNYYLIAQWTSWVLAVPIGTVTLKYLVFKGTGPLRTDVLRAYFVYLPGLGLSSAVLWFTVSVFGLSPETGQLLTIAVAAVFSYVGHKYFTFSHGRA
jgi:putative flippase GtrA